LARHHSRKRRALVRSAEIADFTAEQWEQKVAYWGNRCYLNLEGICTGSVDELDHVKPISKGGAHMLANARPACRPCNRSKAAKWPFATIR
jgi:5-methylcytosine-specific restriction endonuclease McrA